MSESNYSRVVGSKLQFYRKKRGLTLDKLAKTVYKSRSTLSKYENGNIPIDVETLCVIADALHISPRDLFGRPAEMDKQTNPPLSRNEDKYSLKYLYIWDGRPHRNLLVESVIEVDELGGYVNLYWNIQSHDDYMNCKWVYRGTRLESGATTRFVLHNSIHEMDMMVINYLNLLTQHAIPVFGNLVYNPIGQYENYCAKCLISETPMQKSESLKEQLRISKLAVNELKKTNIFRTNML